MVLYQDRIDAGKRLASVLIDYLSPHSRVLGIPRGGVIVAREISDYFHIPLSCIVSKKLSHPLNEELAIGALAEETEIYLDEYTTVDIPYRLLKQEIERKTKEIERRVAVLRKGKPLIINADETILLVDDGIATGATMFAAVHYVSRYTTSLIIAVPVADISTIKKFQDTGIRVVCPYPQESLESIGSFYRNFVQVSDDEVITALRKN